jgi:hypothetical protein
MRKGWGRSHRPSVYSYFPLLSIVALAAGLPGVALGKGTTSGIGFIGSPQAASSRPL